MMKTLNKEMTSAEIVAQLHDGMTIGIGGWGPRRKPMALVREILRSNLKDLTLVGYGGMDMGMLAAAGKVKKLIYGFVSLDFVPLEPFFRHVREAGSVEIMELDEGLLYWGLRAAAMRLPFLPTRVGLGTDFVKANPGIKTIHSPYADGETLLAMPALKLDVALLHVHKADRRGNVRLYAPDPFFDEWIARAADRAFVSCEDLVDDVSGSESDAHYSPYERNLVTGVVQIAGGAHPTSNASIVAGVTAYGWDAAHIKEYCAAASEDSGWTTYRAKYLAGDEAAYQRAAGGTDKILALPRQVM
ncbi:MAG TPA: CoA-transferase [Nevskiaceae bacterium]|nr:CoA-transferase [Nevskiaceae bacterium]